MMVVLTTNLYCGAAGVPSAEAEAAEDDSEIRAFRTLLMIALFQPCVWACS